MKFRSAAGRQTFFRDLLERLFAKAGREPFLVVSMFLCVASLLFVWVALQPMLDADLWWHLKTGELIVEQGALPTEDLFAYTSEAFSSPREHSILRGYPASQVIYYLVQSLAGFPGLLVLRICLLAGVGVAVIRGALKRGANLLPVAVVLALGWVSFYWAHTADRPHIFSFLFFTLLISSMRPGGRESWWIIPMMMVWSNFHGGYIAGALAIMVYLVGRFFDVGWGGEFRRSLVWGGACIVVSFLNPNGAYFLKEALFGSVAGSFSSGVTEYQSTFTVFAEGRYWPLVLWGELFLALLARVGLKRLVWSETLPLILFAFLAMMYVRMTAFFALGMAPFIASDLSTLLATARPVARKVGITLLLLMIAIPAFLNGQDVIRGWQVFWPEQNAFYPAQSVPFLKDANLQGQMFNYYAWGGYLIWKLYPRYQVFIDGRALDDRLFADYKQIEAGNQGEYDQLLERYQVDFAVIPMQNVDGSLLPIFTQMYRNPRWLPVYSDLRTAIFVRNQGQNDDFLSEKRIPQAEFFEKVINGFRSRVAANGGDIAAWRGGVEFYLASYRFQEARSVLSQALQVAPDDPGLQGLIPLVGGIPGR